MAKVKQIYRPVILVECPEKWTHYKEIKNGTLAILESEHKYPGEQFFDFSGLRSSMIKYFRTRQSVINDDVHIDIITSSGSRYMFKIIV